MQPSNTTLTPRGRGLGARPRRLRTFADRTPARKAPRTTEDRAIELGGQGCVNSSSDSKRFDDVRCFFASSGRARWFGTLATRAVGVAASRDETERTEATTSAQTRCLIKALLSGRQRWIASQRPNTVVIAQIRHAWRARLAGLWTSPAPSSPDWSARPSAASRNGNSEAGRPAGRPLC